MATLRAALPTSSSSLAASPPSSSAASSPFGAHLRLPMPPSEEDATDVLICSDSEDDADPVRESANVRGARALADATPRVMAAARFSEAKSSAAAARSAGAASSDSGANGACVGQAGSTAAVSGSLGMIVSPPAVAVSSLPSMFSLSTKLVSNPSEDPLTIVQNVLADEPTCEELLVQVESLARLWDLPLASRTFRDNLPASLSQRIGIPGSDKEGQLYPVNILRAACMPSSNVLLNDRVYIFSQTLVANSANIRDAFAELIKMIHETHGHEDDTPGWRRNKHSWLAFHCFFRHTTSSKRKHIRRVLKRFDEAWREFERCYAREMKAILVEARKPMLEAIEVEATIERLETSYNSRPAAAATASSFMRTPQTARTRSSHSTSSASSSSQQAETSTGVDSISNASRVSYRVTRFVDKLLQMKSQASSGVSLTASFDTAAPLSRSEVARLAAAVRVIDSHDPSRHMLDKSRRNPFTDTQHLRLFKLLHRFCNMISSATRTPVDQQYIDVSVFQMAEEYFKRKLARESTPSTRTFRASRSLPVYGPESLQRSATGLSTAESLFERAASSSSAAGLQGTSSTAASSPALQLDPVCLLYGDVLAAYTAFRSCLRRYRTHVHDLSPQITENADLTRAVLDLQRAFRAAGRFAAHHNRRLGLTVLTELMVELIATDGAPQPRAADKGAMQVDDGVPDSPSPSPMDVESDQSGCAVGSRDPCGRFSFGSSFDDTGAEVDSVYERLQYSDPDTLFSLPCFLLWRALLRGDARCQAVVLAFYPHAGLNDEDYVAASRLAGKVRAVLGACTGATATPHSEEDLTPSVCGENVCAACHSLPVDLFLAQSDGAAASQDQEGRVRDWLARLVAASGRAGHGSVDKQVPNTAVSVVTEFAERLRRCSARLQRCSAVEWNESIMLGVDYICRIIDNAE